MTRTPRTDTGADAVRDRPLRVLLVLGTSAGGVGRHVEALVAGLGARGVRVVVAAPASTLAAFDLEAGGARAVEVPVTDRPNPPGDARAVARLRALAAGADVVHAHGVRAGALAVLAARSLVRRPRVVVTAHNAPPGSGWLRRVYELLERVVARGGDVVLVVSGDLGERARRLGARHVERALVPSPAGPPPTRTAADVRAELGVGDGAALVVCAARLAPQKGLDTLLDAAGLLRDRAVLVALAGDGPLEASLAARVAAERLPVRLLGRRADVPDLFAAADVAVQASAWEGQPLVVQEALRAGAALVATDVGGTREVAGDAAVLVRAGDPAALAAGVRALLDDPVRRATLRAAARARAQTLPTDDEAVEQVLAVYVGAPDRGPAGR